MQEMKAIRDLYDPHGGRAIGSRDPNWLLIETDEEE